MCEIGCLLLHCDLPTGRPGVGPAAVNGKASSKAAGKPGARRGKRTRYDTSSSSEDEEDEEPASEDETDEVQYPCLACYYTLQVDAIACNIAKLDQTHHDLVCFEQAVLPSI